MTLPANLKNDLQRTAAQPDGTYGFNLVVPRTRLAEFKRADINAQPVVESDESTIYHVTPTAARAALAAHARRRARKHGRQARISRRANR